MNTEDPADRHLREAFDELVRALYVTKQLVWSAPAAERSALQDVLAFLVEQSHRAYDLEDRASGRANEFATPSSHVRQNLLGEVDSDFEAALIVYAERLARLTDNLRSYAAEMGDAEGAQLLTDVADGLQARAAEIGAEKR